ncbi:MAG TPA: hypothetical protein VE869_09850 [Gemmatimonas sp.]|nr:hypothetical protein [Gemmatimonas sp.]
MLLRSRLALVMGLGGLLTAPWTLRGQTASGAGDDAIPISRGGVRIRVAGQWNDWGQVYTDSAGSYRRRPLLGSVASPAFGPTAMSQLRSTEQAIRDLTGVNSFSLSLGALEARGDVRQSTAPVSVDVGITSRLSVTLLVPYVESRDNTQLILNRAGSGATVGANPAFGTTGVTARVQNGQLLRQIASARTQLTAEIARCAVTTATGCDAIRANVAGAQSLLQRATAAQGAISTVYGDSLRGGAPVVPLTSNAAGAAVSASVASLRSAFEAFGVTSIGATSLPAGATVVYGPGSLEDIARDSAFRLGYNRLGNTRRAGIGDVDLSASFLLFDSFSASQRRRLTNTSRALRSMATVGWRFGTAAADDPLDAFDVPIGDGANAVFARSTTDFVLGRALWMSATVRMLQPFGDEIVAAVPLRTDSSIFSAFGLETVRRKLGSRLELEVAPRYAFGDFFGISAAYLYRRTGEATFEVAEPGASSAPALTSLTLASTTLQAASFGITFSTLASYIRGRSRLPLEIIFTHTEPVTASGGIVPAVASDRLELRVHTGFSKR